MVASFRLIGHPGRMAPVVISSANACHPAAASTAVTYIRGGVEDISMNGVLKTPMGTPPSRTGTLTGLVSFLFQRILPAGIRVRMVGRGNAASAYTYPLLVAA